MGDVSKNVSKGVGKVPGWVVPVECSDSSAKWRHFYAETTPEATDSDPPQLQISVFADTAPVRERHYLLRLQV